METEEKDGGDVYKEVYFKEFRRNAFPGDKDGQMKPCKPKERGSKKVVLRLHKSWSKGPDGEDRYFVA